MNSASLEGKRFQVKGTANARALRQESAETVPGTTKERGAGAEWGRRDREVAGSGQAL